MGQTASVFGPISQDATVAGNTATVIFQAVGGPKRITNLFAKVSTAVLQAQCSLYVGFISDGSRVYISQSGSTGFSARGSIDLIDGQVLYVVWTNADNGATATATFTGHDLNLGEVGNSSITGEDPIAADDGSLIFPAIKSPNFVTGISGWELDRNGNAELNNVTVRGTLDVVDPTDGTFVKVFDENPGDGAVIDLGDASHTTRIRYGTSPNTGFLGLLIEGVGGTVAPSVELTQDNFGASVTRIAADKVYRYGLQYNAYEVDEGRGRIFSVGISSPSAAIGASETIIITCPSFTYKADRAYRMVVSGLMTLSVAGNRPIFKFRKTNLAGAIVAQTGISSNSTGQEGADWNGEFWIDSSDVTATLVFTVVASAAFTATVLAGTGITGYDMGPAVEYGYKTQLS